jgi:formate dehydrogenase major subunit
MGNRRWRHQHFRGHDNVQGATDLWRSGDTPSRATNTDHLLDHGLTKRVWEEDLDYPQAVSHLNSLATRHDEPDGYSVSRWIDGVSEDAADIDQPDNTAQWFCGDMHQTAKTRRR